jgi:hypothetical protein
LRQKQQKSNDQGNDQRENDPGSGLGLGLGLGLLGRMATARHELFISLPSLRKLGNDISHRGAMDGFGF